MRTEKGAITRGLRVSLGMRTCSTRKSVGKRMVASVRQGAVGDVFTLEFHTAVAVHQLRPARRAADTSQMAAGCSMTLPDISWGLASTTANSIPSGETRQETEPRKPAVCGQLAHGQAQAVHGVAPGAVPPRFGIGVGAQGARLSREALSCSVQSCRIGV